MPHLNNDLILYRRSIYYSYTSLATASARSTYAHTITTIGAALVFIDLLAYDSVITNSHQRDYDT